MKVLIAYDSVSPMKLTAKVAEQVGAALKENGIDFDNLFVGDADVAKVKDYDCVLVGGPTMAFRVSKDVSRFLDGLPKGEFSGKQAAAFDTQLSSRLSGSAAMSIDSRLKKLGFKMIAAPLIVYVEGKMNQMNLKEGEIEKTKTWAEEIAKSLVK